MVPHRGEDSLLATIFDDEEDHRDIDCLMVDSWMARLVKDRKPVFWKELLELDWAGRSQPANPIRADADEGVGEDAMKKVLISIQEGMVKMNQTMEDGFTMLRSMFDGHERRLKGVERFVESQDFDFGVHDYNPPSRFWSKGGCSSGGGVVENEAATEVEKEKERQAEKEKEKEIEAEKEKEKERLADLEKEKEVEKEKERLAELEKERQAEKEKEDEKEKARLTELEKERAAEKEIEAEKEKTEAEKEKGLEGVGENEVVGEKRMKKPAAALRTPYEARTFKRKKKM